MSEFIEIVGNKSLLPGPALWRSEVRFWMGDCHFQKLSGFISDNECCFIEENSELITKRKYYPKIGRNNLFGLFMWIDEECDYEASAKTLENFANAQDYWYFCWESGSLEGLVTSKSECGIQDAIKLSLARYYC